MAGLNGVTPPCLPWLLGAGSCPLMKSQAVLGLSARSGTTPLRISITVVSGLILVTTGFIQYEDQNPLLHSEVKLLLPRPGSE